MNPLPPKVNRGTLGELLAQLYLLANGVQAAPPLRDSGNDLIACRRRDILALQVKTRKKHSFSKHHLPELYDGGVFVVLREDRGICDISKPDVYLMSRAEIEAAASFGAKAMRQFRICPERVDEVFRKGQALTSNYGRRNV